MRSLKFRAWDGKKMIDDVIPASETSIIELFEYEWKETEVKAVEQYTGLRDKNGKKIYEGDIVRYGRHLRGIVLPESLTEIVRWRSGKEGYEVIGNVHENPELLEAKDVD